MTAKVVRLAGARVDRNAFEAIRNRYADSTDAAGMAKYLDLDAWIDVNVQRARSLGLGAGRSRRILDIGTGCGYFPFVAGLLGHEAIGIDRVRRSRMYGEVTELLGVTVYEHDVAPFSSLPALDRQPFDLITAYMVTFNGHGRAPWGVAEWQHFVADARSRLRGGGRIVLELNCEPPPMNACYTPELRDAFIAMGAEITGRWPHRPSPTGHRLVFQR